MVSVGLSQLRLGSGWAELWGLPLHSGLKQRLLLLLLFGVCFSWFIYSATLCFTASGEGKKKLQNNKIHCNFKKKKKKRPREKKELNELICSESWGERRAGGKKRKTLWNIFQQLFFFELELRRKVVLCLAVCCGAASPPALLQCAAGSEAATHLVSITASHRSSKRL